MFLIYNSIKTYANQCHLKKNKKVENFIGEGSIYSIRNTKYYSKLTLFRQLEMFNNVINAT